MSKNWQKITLGKLLERAVETVQPDIDSEYSEITVRLWGKGVFERGKMNGALLSSRRFLARKNQFIVSRIDARNGAMGIVPEFLDGAIVTNDFPLFNLNTGLLDYRFIGWLCRTNDFVELCRRASEGTTNRVRLKEDRFLNLEIRLPELSEQKRVVTRIEELSHRITKCESIWDEQQSDLRAMLLSTFKNICKNVVYKKMKDIAPQVRRPISIGISEYYPELGIRCFGNGTFHKPALSGFELGSKRVFTIKKNDLLFSNVFAWEGAIAVARAEDDGRVGSHRYITCVPIEGIATSQFLNFYFLTDEGLEKIGKASPGGAGRNRTLGLTALDEVEIPVPPIDKQHWFDNLVSKVSEIKNLQSSARTDINTLMPSILDQAFRGEL